MKKSMSILLVLALVLSICAPLSALATGGGLEPTEWVDGGDGYHYAYDGKHGCYVKEIADDVYIAVESKEEADSRKHELDGDGKCVCGYEEKKEEPEECQHHGMSVCVKWSTLFGKFVSVDCFYCADCGKFFASVAGGNALDAHAVLVDTYLGDGIKKEEEAEKVEKAIAKVAVGVSNLFDKVGVAVKATTKSVSTLVSVLDPFDKVNVAVKAGDLGTKTTKTTKTTTTKVGLFKLW